MAKDPKVRIDQGIEGIVAGVGYGGYATFIRDGFDDTNPDHQKKLDYYQLRLPTFARMAIENALGRTASTGGDLTKAEAEIHEELSLGWRGFGDKKPQESFRRNAIRGGVLLAFALDGKSIRQVRALKSELERLKVTEIYERLYEDFLRSGRVTLGREKDDLAANKVLQKFADRAIVWMPSTGVLSSLERHLLSNTVTTAQSLMYVAREHINNFHTFDALARSRYERWFGAFNAKRYAKVKATIVTIHDYLCTKQIAAYYRGRKAEGRGNDSEFERDRASKPIIVDEECFGYVYQSEPQTSRVSVYFADAALSVTPRKKGHFVTTKHGIFKAVIGNQKLDTEGYDCPAGVLIHELSHALCATEDHGYSREIALDLAANSPDKAAENADNIEYFCENCWVEVEPTLQERTKNGELTIDRRTEWRSVS